MTEETERKVAEGLRQFHELREQIADRESEIVNLRRTMDQEAAQFREKLHLAKLESEAMQARIESLTGDVSHWQLEAALCRQEMRNHMEESLRLQAILANLGTLIGAAVRDPMSARLGDDDAAEIARRIEESNKEARKNLEAAKPDFAEVDDGVKMRIIDPGVPMKASDSPAEPVAGSTALPANELTASQPPRRRVEKA